MNIAYEQQVELRKLALVGERMTSLVKSTANIDNIKIKVGPDWAYSPSLNTIYYPVSGPVGIKTLSKPTIIGILLHEVSHARYTGQVDLGDLGVIPHPAKEYAKLINCLEDLRVESLMMERMPGTYDSFSRVSVNAWDRFKQGDNILKLKQHDNLLVNMYFEPWGYEPKFLNKKVEEFNAKHGYLFKEAATQDSMEKLNNFVKEKVWPVFKELLPPEKKCKNKKDKKQEEKQDKKQEEKQDKKQEEKQDKKQEEKQDKKQEEKQDKKQEGDNNQQEQPKNSEELQKALDSAMDISEMLDALKDNGMIDESLNSQEGQSFYDSLDNPEDIDDHKDCATNTLPNLQDSDLYFGDNVFETDKIPYEVLYESIKPYLLFFTKKLDSILIDNNHRRFGGSFKYGKLSTKQLYKFRCKNLRLFNKRILRQHRTYSVCLLIDESGSMYGDRIRNSTEAAVLLAEVLHKVNIPFEIRGFNTTFRTYKKYDEAFTWAIKRNIEFIIPQTKSWRARGTSDAYAINRANYTLSKREGERILIVLSDGRPNPESNAILEEDRKRLPSRFITAESFSLSEEIKKGSQRSALIGVGIKTSYVTKHYPQAVVCHDVSKLPRQLLNIIKRNVKRG